MSTRPTMINQAKTITEDGPLELATNDALIQTDRSEFANVHDLNVYLSQVTGGKIDGEGIHGAISHKGRYARRAPDGSPAVTLGDAVLDSVASATGTLVLAGQTIQLNEPATSQNGPISASGTVVFDAPLLKFTGIVNGAERWAYDDKSLVEYRIGTGRLIFHAWKKDTVYLYWSMGGEISVIDTGTQFEAADIFAFSYMSVLGHPPCAVYNPGHSSSLNDTYLDQYDWGWHSQQPERTAVLCRAQWHHAQFRDVLTAGDGCLRYLTEDWPIGFPPDWNTIQTVVELNGSWTDGSANHAVISVHFKTLAVDMSAFHRPTANGSVSNSSTISVTFPDDKTYTGTLIQPNTIQWSNGSAWHKVVNTLLDLNGAWTDGTRRAIISEGIQSLSIDMSDYDRPAAHGTIISASTISVTFPDDKTYTGTVQNPKTIKWSNGSAWTKL